jgi:AtzE family amidohydrolase
MTSPITEALARIDADNARFNCFTSVYRDDARAAAETPADGPLAGVPFAVKDLYDVAGRTTLAGSRIYADNPPAERDAAAVARLRAAGAVPVGATNMDEFAFGFTTENPHYGATRNPRDPDRSAGGSSGGSAAAVAAGMVPLALGSDTNGSVRVPAALCGVYGLKPTFGRLSRAGVAPLAWSFDHVGVFARSPRDIARAYDAMQGPDANDPACTDRPPEPAEPVLDDGISGLRIAVADGYFATGGLPEVFAAVGRAADALGADQRVDIPEADRALAASLLITSAEGASLHLDEIRDRIADFDPHTRDRWVAATMIPATWVHDAQRFRRRFRDRVAAVFADIDVLITPTTAFPAPVLGQGRITIDGSEAPVRGTLGRFTAPFSFIGLPAISVPMKVEADKLPLGVQIVAQPWAEATVLRVVAELEKNGVTAE